MRLSDALREARFSPPQSVFLFKKFQWKCGECLVLTALQDPRNEAIASTLVCCLRRIHFQNPKADELFE